MNKLIQIKLVVMQQALRPYFIASIKGALTLPHISDPTVRMGPGEWLSKDDAQYLIAHPEIYEITVVSAA
jgi:hypothetical protein